MKDRRQLAAISEVLGDAQETFLRKYYVQYGEGAQFELLSHGLCQWTKVSFVLCGKEFYKLTRTVSAELEDECSERKEYFNGRLKRTYAGKQNCFIEFCDFLQTCVARSMRQKVIQATQELMLDTKTARMYGVYYKRFF